MSKVLIIGDTHIPFVHPNYLRFLRDVIDTHQPDRIVHIGDLVDHHALSRYVSDPDGLTSGGEWEASLAELQRYVKVFPEVDWIIGNHDKRPFLKAYDTQIPKSFLKPIEDIYELPRTWSAQTTLEIDGTLYTHGVASGGASGWQNLALKQGQSTVIGHIHSVGGVRYHQTPRNQLFTLAVGCGVDEDAYAMAYGRDFTARPMLGCGLVTDGVEAQFIPMNIHNRSYSRKRRSIV